MHPKPVTIDILLNDKKWNDFCQTKTFIILYSFYVCESLLALRASNRIFGAYFSKRINIILSIFIYISTR